MLQNLVRASLAALAVVALSFTSPAHAGPPTQEEFDAAMKTLRAHPVAKNFFKSSYGYAVFPTVGRGSFAIGAAYGEGYVFKQGKKVAKTTLTQVSIGLGAGGEAYTEIVFFKDKAAFDRFASGNLEFNGRATAAAGTAAAQGETGYNDGVAIVTVTKGGLIADASIGGQKFSYEKL